VSYEVIKLLGKGYSLQNWYNEFLKMFRALYETKEIISGSRILPQIESVNFGFTNGSLASSAPLSTAGQRPYLAQSVQATPHRLENRGAAMLQFLIFTCRPDGFWGPTTLYVMSLGGLFRQELKQPGR
jgi:hypothetical protein